MSLVPILIIYWIMVQFGSEDLNAFRVLLSIPAKPIIDLVSNIIVYEVEGVDLTPIVSVIFLLILFSLLSYALKTVYEIENKAELKKGFDDETPQQELKRKVEENYIQTLWARNLIFFMVEINKSKLSNYNPVTVKPAMEQVKRLISSVHAYRGDLIEENESSMKDTYSFTFNSQEDALNYAFYIEKNIINIDRQISPTTGNISFRGVLDCHLPNAMNFYVIQILEKSIKTVAPNKYYTTAVFSERYQKIGMNKILKFNSKGVYSIQGERIEFFELKKS